VGHVAARQRHEYQHLAAVPIPRALRVREGRPSVSRGPKAVRTNAQFRAGLGRPDASARPLVVTEGSADDKLEAIEDNVYLSHALDRLYERDLPIVVFGSSLGEQDAHLAEALSQHPDRPIAVSMLPASKKELRLRQNDLYGRLESELLFFDATTHPLGDPSLSRWHAGDPL
jgi:hypothetical protein